MSKQLEFIYDIVSAPCYLAWAQLSAIVEESGAEILLTPFFAVEYSRLSAMTVHSEFQQNPNGTKTISKCGRNVSAYH